MEEILYSILKWVIFNIPVWIVAYITAKRHAKLLVKFDSLKEKTNTYVKANMDTLMLMQKMQKEHNENCNELTIAAMHLNDKFQELEKKGDVK